MTLGDNEPSKMILSLLPGGYLLVNIQVTLKDFLFSRFVIFQFICFYLFYCILSQYFFFLDVCLSPNGN